MKIKTAAILLAGFLAGAACSTVDEGMVTAMFQSYISAQEALAADDAGRAKEALKSLAEEADPVIERTALDAAQAEDLDHIRAKFKELSGKIETLELPKGYVVAFCPMADHGNGATWVQKDGDIKNPYFGKEMLSCGEIKKKIE